MARSLSPLGDNCAQVGISAEDLVSGHKLPELRYSVIKKGVVYNYQKYNYHIYQPVKSKRRDKIFEKEGFLVKKWDILKTFVKSGLNYQV